MDELNFVPFNKIASAIMKCEWPTFTSGNDKLSENFNMIVCKVDWWELDKLIIISESIRYKLTCWLWNISLRVYKRVPRRSVT